jgi:hypothetical protein
MKFLDLKNISERFMDLLNPTTPEKILKAGQIAGLRPGDKVPGLLNRLFYGQKNLVFRVWGLMCAHMHVSEQ